MTSIEIEEAVDEAEAFVESLERRMDEAASNLEFELAADIRDRIREVRQAYDLVGEEEGVPAPAEEY
jgi:excinuclease ABC subunit B